MSGGSPLPRSRSDFGYVGLSSTREKRFSLLLPPPFTTPSGYSRLAETPVTLQPRSPSFSEALSPKPALKSPTTTTENNVKPKSPRPFPKSPSLDHRCNGAHKRSPTGEFRHSVARSPTLEPRRTTPRAVRKSPTLDSTRALRYSPLLNQTLISRSPTLDPSVLNRGGLGDEVVRSQSLRSLRRSPLKMRGSESAQSDVTCPIHRPFPLCEEEDIRRLRNFSVTSKGGLINWGDSFRSHSLTSMPDARWPPALATSASEQWTSSTSAKTPHRFKVAILGVDEVGKTSLIRQFQTSEYICAFDTSYDINKDYAITVILNKEESDLEFIEYRLPDEEEMEVGDEEVPAADAHVVVYSVTSRRSFTRALDLLGRIRRLFRRSALVLVGNKSDLVRVRAVTTDEGESSAGEGVVFVETSTAINHQVDELLVSILSRIRAKSRANEAQRPSLARAIKRFLKKACFHAKSASADNLQRL